MNTAGGGFPSADGAFERFLTAAIATIITIMFSWRLLTDVNDCDSGGCLLAAPPVGLKHLALNGRHESVDDDDDDDSQSEGEDGEKKGKNSQQKKRVKKDGVKNELPGRLLNTWEHTCSDDLLDYETCLRIVQQHERALHLDNNTAGLNKPVENVLNSNNNNNNNNNNDKQKINSINTITYGERDKLNDLTHTQLKVASVSREGDSQNSNLQLRYATTTNSINRTTEKKRFVSEKEIVLKQETHSSSCTPLEVKKEVSSIRGGITGTKLNKTTATTTPTITTAAELSNSSQHNNGLANCNKNTYWTSSSVLTTMESVSPLQQVLTPPLSTCLKGNSSLPISTNTTTTGITTSTARQSNVSSSSLSTGNTLENLHGSLMTTIPTSPSSSPSSPSSSSSSSNSFTPVRSKDPGKNSLHIPQQRDPRPKQPPPPPPPPRKTPNSDINSVMNSTCSNNNNNNADEDIRLITSTNIPSKTGALPAILGRRTLSNNNNKASFANRNNPSDDAPTSITSTPTTAHPATSSVECHSSSRSSSEGVDTPSLALNRVEGGCNREFRDIIEDDNFQQLLIPMKDPNSNSGHRTMSTSGFGVRPRYQQQQHPRLPSYPSYQHHHSSSSSSHFYDSDSDSDEGSESESEVFYLYGLEPIEEEDSDDLSSDSDHSVDYEVKGAFPSSLSFDEHSKVNVDQLPAKEAPPLPPRAEALTQDITRGRIPQLPVRRKGMGTAVHTANTYCDELLTTNNTTITADTTKSHLITPSDSSSDDDSSNNSSSHSNSDSFPTNSDSHTFIKESSLVQSPQDRLDSPKVISGNTHSIPGFLPGHKTSNTEQQTNPESLFTVPRGNLNEESIRPEERLIDSSSSTSINLTSSVTGSIIKQNESIAVQHEQMTTQQSKSNNNPTSFFSIATIDPSPVIRPPPFLQKSLSQSFVPTEPCTETLKRSVINATAATTTTTTLTTTTTALIGDTSEVDAKSPDPPTSTNNSTEKIPVQNLLATKGQALIKPSLPPKPKPCGITLDKNPQSDKAFEVGQGDDKNSSPQTHRPQPHKKVIISTAIPVSSSPTQGTTVTARPLSMTVGDLSDTSRDLTTYNETSLLNFSTPERNTHVKDDYVKPQTRCLLVLSSNQSRERSYSDGDVHNNNSNIVQGPESHQAPFIEILESINSSTRDDQTHRRINSSDLPDEEFIVANGRVTQLTSSLQQSSPFYAKDSTAIKMYCDAQRSNAAENTPRGFTFSYKEEASKDYSQRNYYQDNDELESDSMNNNTLDEDFTDNDNQEIQIERKKDDSSKDNSREINIVNGNLKVCDLQKRVETIIVTDHNEVETQNVETNFDKMDINYVDIEPINVATNFNKLDPTLVTTDLYKVEQKSLETDHDKIDTNNIQTEIYKINTDYTETDLDSVDINSLKNDLGNANTITNTTSIDKVDTNNIETDLDKVDTIIMETNLDEILTNKAEVDNISVEKELTKVDIIDFDTYNEKTNAINLDSNKVSVLKKKIHGQNADRVKLETDVDALYTDNAQRNINPTDQSKVNNIVLNTDLVNVDSVTDTEKIGDEHLKSGNVILDPIPNNPITVNTILNIVDNASVHTHLNMNNKENNSTDDNDNRIQMNCYINNNNNNTDDHMTSELGLSGNQIINTSLPKEINNPIETKKNVTYFPSDTNNFNNQILDNGPVILKRQLSLNDADTTDTVSSWSPVDDAMDGGDPMSEQLPSQDDHLEDLPEEEVVPDNICVLESGVVMRPPPAVTTGSANPTPTSHDAFNDSYSSGSENRYTVAETAALNYEASVNKGPEEVLSFPLSSRESHTENQNGHSFGDVVNADTTFNRELSNLDIDYEMFKMDCLSHSEDYASVYSLNKLGTCTSESRHEPKTLTADSSTEMDNSNNNNNDSNNRDVSSYNETGEEFESSGLLAGRANLSREEEEEIEDHLTDLNSERFSPESRIYGSGRHYTSAHQRPLTIHPEQRMESMSSTKMPIIRRKINATRNKYFSADNVSDIAAMGVENTDSVSNKFARHQKATVRALKRRDAAKRLQLHVDTSLIPIQGLSASESLSHLSQVNSRSKLYSFPEPRLPRPSYHEVHPDCILSPSNADFLEETVRAASIDNLESCISRYSSITSLVETDLDTGETVERHFSFDFDVFENPFSFQRSYFGKSASMMDLHSGQQQQQQQQVRHSTGRGRFADRHVPKSKSMQALETNLDDDDEDDLLGESTFRRVPSIHELRVSRSLQKLNVPDWYKKSSVSRSGSCILNRDSDSMRSYDWRFTPSLTSSPASSIISQNAPVVIKTRVTPAYSRSLTTPMKAPKLTLPPKPANVPLPSDKFRTKDKPKGLMPIPIVPFSKIRDMFESKSRECTEIPSPSASTAKMKTTPVKLAKPEPPKRITPVKRPEHEVPPQPKKSPISQGFSPALRIEEAIEETNEEEEEMETPDSGRNGLPAAHEFETIKVDTSPDVSSGHIITNGDSHSSRVLPNTETESTTLLVKEGESYHIVEEAPPMIRKPIARRAVPSEEPPEPLKKESPKVPPKPSSSKSNQKEEPVEISRREELAAATPIKTVKVSDRILHFDSTQTTPEKKEKDWKPKLFNFRDSSKQAKAPVKQTPPQPPPRPKLTVPFFRSRKETTV